MWLAGLDRHLVDVYIGEGQVACVTRDGELWQEQVDGVDAAVAALRGYFDGPVRTGHRSLRIWLSGALCRPFLLARPTAVLNAFEFERIARAMAPDLTGLAGPCAVWCDRFNAADSALVAAASESLVAMLGDLRCGKQCQVKMLRPWWSEALRLALKTKPDLRTGTLAIRESDSLTVLSGEGGCFLLAASHAPLGDERTFKSTWLRTSAAIDLTHYPATHVKLDLLSGRGNPTQVVGAFAKWAKVDP